MTAPLPRQSMLITGGAGYLGQRIIQLALEWDVHATYFNTQLPDYVPATLHRLDLADRTATLALVERIRPRVIIHTAPGSRDIALEAIVPAALNVVEAATAIGARLIHVSTDIVFDGRTPPYDENSPIAPVNQYGRLKAEAENIVRERVPAAVIVRPSLIFGHDPIDRHASWLVAALREGNRVTLYKDELRSPIWVDNLAYALLELSASSFVGTLNLGSPQAINRWDFGVKLLDMLDLKPSANIVPGSVADADEARPRDLTLNVALAQRVLRTPLLTVDGAILRIKSRRRAFHI